VKVSTEGQEVKNMIEKRMESRATSGNSLAGLNSCFSACPAAIIVRQSIRQMINKHIGPPVIIQICFLFSFELSAHI
jgi:hypothetical protein